VSSEAAIETRPLGRSGVEIPRVSLGCGNFGGIGSAPQFFGQGADEATAFAIMDAAWELGISHFDTADAYGGGNSESTIGRWIASRGVRPLLTTKTYNPMVAGGDHGLAPERLTRQLHSSLERLGVDRVELVGQVELDAIDAQALVVAALEGFRSEGLIAASGVSNYDAPQLRATLAAGHVDAIQNSYSLLVRDDERELLPLCAAEQVSYSVYSPLAGGWLTGKYRRGAQFPEGSRMTQRPDGYAALLSDEVFDSLESLEQLGRQRGISMAGLALAWLLANPLVSAIVVGPMRPEHLEPLREALANPLSPAEREAVEGMFA